MTDIHVVLGTGPLGLAVVRALRGRDEQVRAVNRSGDAPVPDDVAAARTDLSKQDRLDGRVQVAQIYSLSISL